MRMTTKVRNKLDGVKAQLAMMLPMTDDDVAGVDDEEALNDSY